MSEVSSTSELRVVFDAETIRRYGGTGPGMHSDEEEAISRGFPGLVSWGTLTVLPFWQLMGRLAGPDWALGGTLDVRLTKPVCAGDEVTYTAKPAADDSDAVHAFELVATTERYGVVATAQAIVGPTGAADTSTGER